MKKLIPFLFAVVAYAQPQCSQTLFTTTTGRQPALTNKTSGCSNWSFQYWTSNVATISIEVDTAPDNGSGLPGSWTAVSPVSFGVNPSTTLFGLIQFTTYAPFVSVNITSLGLTANPAQVSWTLFGVNSIASSKGAGGGSGANVFLSNLSTPTAINQNLFFQPDGTLSIGGGASGRPSNINITGNFVNSGGGITAVNGTVVGGQFQTGTACASASGTCGSAASGTVSIAAAATTVTVSTTAVHTGSVILLLDDSSKGGTLSVTCNTTTPSSLSVTAVTNGTSFVITATAPVTNPLCIDYFIVD